MTFSASGYKIRNKFYDVSCLVPMSISRFSVKALWLVCLLGFQMSSYAQEVKPDFTHLHETALMATAAYLLASDTQARLSPLGWRVVVHKELPVNGVQYYLAVKDKKQLVVIRGTANSENVMVDLDLQLQPQADLKVEIHQGFASAATAVMNDVEDLLNKELSIETAGHSLGGAVAQILAMKLSIQGFDVTRVTTYGQPKVTNITGANAFEHLPLIRVVTPQDLVPIVPALSPFDLERLDIYWHSGIELILLDEGQYSVTSGISSMLRATKFLKKVPDESNAQAHDIQTYIALLANNRAKAVEVPYKSDFSIFGIAGE